jgi:hypothetical protein
MRMVIDAMDMLYRGGLEGLGIMSSDSDFLPLAQRIREAGIPVYGFGTAKTPISFQNSCTRFFDVAALAANGERGEDEPNEGRVADAELLNLLGAAWKQSKRDADGFASLSEVGQRAKAVLSFSVRNYGARSLKELVRTMPEFQVKETESGALLVRRVR